MSQPVWNLTFDLIVSSRTPARNSRYLWDSCHKITCDSLSTYLRIQYLSDHYPKTTHNLLRTNIFLFVSESITNLARWLLTISWHFVFMSLCLYKTLSLHSRLLKFVSPELKFVRLQINSFYYLQPFASSSSSSLIFWSTKPGLKYPIPLLVICAILGPLGEFSELIFFICKIREMEYLKHLFLSVSKDLVPTGPYLWKCFPHWKLGA